MPDFSFIHKPEQLPEPERSRNVGARINKKGQ